MDVTQVHLPSGRGIRVRALKPSQLDKALALAAKGIAPDATGIDLKQAETRIALDMFIVQVTREKHDPKIVEIEEPEVEVGVVVNGVPAEDKTPPKKKTVVEQPDAFADPKAWKPWEGTGDPELYDAHFTAADHQVISRLYNREHQPSAAEVSIALGKAKTVVL